MQQLSVRQVAGSVCLSVWPYWGVVISIGTGTSGIVATHLVIQGVRYSMTGQLVARTVGATNMGRQCDKNVQTASFSKNDK